MCYYPPTTDAQRIGGAVLAHDVFISFANQDKATADAVLATLEQQQIRCGFTLVTVRRGPSTPRS